MGSWFQRFVVAASAAALMAGASCSRKQSEQQKAPTGKSLDDALTEAVGAPAALTHRAEWDDGSGGEPERLLGVKDKTVYYFTRDDAAGGKLAGTVVPEPGHGAHGELTGPVWIGFSKRATGFVVVTLTELPTG